MATSALDPELVGEVLSVIRKVAAEGVSMVIVTHEMNFAREVADRILFMEDGVIVEDAPPNASFCPGCANIETLCKGGPGTRKPA